MPEYPDITVYIEKLEELVQGEILENIRIGSPFVLRTALPPVNDLVGRKVERVLRIGKRVVLCFSDNYFAVIHLMILGRLYWKKKKAALVKRHGLAAFDFPGGSLHFVERTTQKRASLHIFQGEDSLETINPGGIEIFESTFDEFKERLVAENHTLKRSLTDPRLFSGIGNAYSDEILHEAGLSPIQHSQKMDSEQIQRLFEAVKSVLTVWTDRLRQEAGSSLPEKVTAFHDAMAVHGKFGKPCPVCGTEIQRIQYASNETNYCPRCQTGGKVLADRGMSRFLKKDWPRTIEELETLNKNQEIEG